MAETHGHSHAPSAASHGHAHQVDDWHDHSHDEKPQQAHTETVKSGLVLGVGVFLFVLIVIACVIVYAFYIGSTTRTLEARERTTTDAPAKVFREWKGQSLVLLENGGSLQVPAGEEGKTKSISILPIKDATKTVVAEYLGKSAAGK